MDILGGVLGMMGAGLVFGIAVWLSPRVIRAVYPEEMQGQILRMQKIMVMIAMMALVLAVFSVLFFALMR